jgi:excisionase family DNA binding protein
MRLTLDQAATTLGKSVRQVRYLIEQGRLRATKVAGRWFVDSEDLPADPDARQRSARREGRLREAVEEVLSPDGRRARYSMRDLKAMQIALPAYRALCAATGEDHPAARELAEALRHLAEGCHRFARHEKGEAYRAARDAVSRCALALLVDDEARHGALVDTLEQDLLAALAGLLRRAERREAAP